VCIVLIVQIPSSQHHLGVQSVREPSHAKNLTLGVHLDFQSQEKTGCAGQAKLFGGSKIATRIRDFLLKNVLLVDDECYGQY
jgi:hypothetical protein